MSLVIDDDATVNVINRIAAESGRSVEEVVREAVAAEDRRQRRTTERMAALKVLQDRAASWPETGLKADKAFFDDLGGGL